MIDTSALAFPKVTTPTKAEKRREKDRLERAFRKAVWKRDKGRDRATGHLLQRTHESPFLRGEVHHIQSKGAHPELRYTVSNGILLSAENHRLAEGRGGGLLLIHGIDANARLQFTRLETSGRILWSKFG